MATTRQANFTLPQRLLDELRRVVPRGDQSRVVAEALQNELKRIKFKQALDTSFGAWRKVAHPELDGGSRALVRSLRRSARHQRQSGRV